MPQRASSVESWRDLSDRSYQSIFARKKKIRPIPREAELELIHNFIRRGKMTVLPCFYDPNGKPDGANPIIVRTYQSIFKIWHVTHTALSGPINWTAKNREARFAVSWALAQKGMDTLTIANSLGKSRSSVRRAIQAMERERKTDRALQAKLTELLGKMG